MCLGFGTWEDVTITRNVVNQSAWEQHNGSHNCVSPIIVIIKKKITTAEHIFQKHTKKPIKKLYLPKGKWCSFVSLLIPFFFVPFMLLSLSTAALQSPTFSAMKGVQLRENISVPALTRVRWVRSTLWLNNNSIKCCILFKWGVCVCGGVGWGLRKERTVIWLLKKGGETERFPLSQTQLAVRAALYGFPMHAVIPVYYTDNSHCVSVWSPCVCLHWIVRRNDGKCNQGQMDYNLIQTDEPITQCVACERHVCVTRCLLRTFAFVTPLQICASPRPHSPIFPAFLLSRSCFVYASFFLTGWGWGGGWGLI